MNSRCFGTPLGLNLLLLALIPAQCAPAANDQKISSMNLEKMFPNPYFRELRIIGINRANELVVNDYGNRNVSGMINISIRRPKKFVVWKADDDDREQFHLSLDGRHLFAVQSLLGANSTREVWMPRFRVYDAKTYVVTHQVVTGTHRNVFAEQAVAFHSDWFCVGILQGEWLRDEKTWARGDEKSHYVEVWNWKSGRKVFSFPHYNAIMSLNEFQVTPDAKRMALMYLSPWAEDSKTPVGPGDDDSPAGTLALVDPRSGRVAWRFGEKTGKMRRPVFFLSNSQMVVRNLKFDLNRKKVTPLFVHGPKEPRLDCVGAVPGVLNRAFFLTRNGLELWDVLRQKPLHRWGSIRKAGQVTLTPDRTILSVRNGWKFDFYSFKASWLKGT